MLMLRFKSFQMPFWLQVFSFARNPFVGVSCFIVFQIVLDDVNRMSISFGYIAVTFSSELNEMKLHQSFYNYIFKSNS